MIIQNAIAVVIPRRKSLKFLVSSQRHHFIKHKFNRNKSIFIDGGLSYLRRGTEGDVQEGRDYFDFSLDDTQDIKTLANKLLWFVYYRKDGKCLKRGARCVLLKELSTEHLISILQYEYPDFVDNDLYFRIIRHILSERA